MIPETDVFLAERRSLMFYVSAKVVPRGPWMRISESIGFREALERAAAQKEQHAEVGVFVEIPSGGLLYWSSRMPDVYNSLVLRAGYT